MDPREKLLRELLSKRDYKAKGIPVDVVREEFKKEGFNKQDMHAAKHLLNLQTISRNEPGKGRVWRWIV